jgi:hypothetical protein
LDGENGDRFYQQRRSQNSPGDSYQT